VALTRFKRTLKWARLSVRELTHTLHLPPAQAEIYDGPHAEWLGDVLEALPNLQSLIVSRLPFFDHQALLALRNGRRNVTDGSCPTFSLRLLIAAQCKNMTASSLAEALTHLVGLAYLDLSGNSSARDPSVLSKLQSMPNLHILRLHHCQLRDSDMEILGSSIGIKVRSLDLRGNSLTDAGIKILLQYCFHTRGTRSRASSGVVIEDSADWPASIARPDANILDEFRDETLSERFARRLTIGIVDRLPSQELRKSGVTHFYIAQNHLSVEGVSTLVRNARLYVLDVGSFETSKVLSKPRAMSSSSPPTSGGRRIALPGAEKLILLLEDFGKDLRYLRLHHSVVTHKAAAREECTALKPVELEGSVVRIEIDSTPFVPELPNGEPAPRYELPGDAMQIFISPAIGEKLSLDAIEAVSSPRRGSAFAPEVINASNAEDEDGPIVTATGLGSMAQAMNGISSRNSQGKLNEDLTTPLDIGANAIFRFAEIEQRLRNLELRKDDKPHGLLPEMLPRLRTIVLTGVPCLDSTGLVDFLIGFIRACALKVEVARLQALRGPDPSRVSNDPSRLQKRSSLQRIVLEMGPPGSTCTGRRPNSPRSPQTPWSAFRTKSSTEDPDSEAFWSAQENDFSFFNDDEECGLPSNESHYFPLSSLSEKMLVPPNEDQPDSLPTLQQPRNVNTVVDVVQELSKFRKDRKAAYEDALRLGQPYVEGYWSGEIKIVRWGARSNHNADYYGNVYERGIYR